MTEQIRRFSLLLLLLPLCATGGAACGPSAEEVRMRTLTHELRAEVREQRQYNEDLKLRLQLAAARNRVLVDLVQGLTSDTARARGTAATPLPLQSANTSLQALDSDMSALVASVHHSEQDLAAMQAQQRALEAELSRAKAAVEVVSAEQAKEQALSDASAAVLALFANLVAERSVAVRVADDRTRVEVSADMLFANNDARVLPSGKTLLDGVAEVLEQVAGHSFEIAAHTDSRPPRSRRYPDNWRLSADRALNVVAYLIERGVPKDRLSASAHADTQPLGDTATEAGQRQNRRIEIVLWPDPPPQPETAPASNEAQPRSAGTAPLSQDAAPQTE
jgi:chemotaxis protein MotB